MPDLTLIEKLRQIADETGSAELSDICKEAADVLAAVEEWRDAREAFWAAARPVGSGMPASKLIQRVQAAEDTLHNLVGSLIL